MTDDLPEAAGLRAGGLGLPAGRKAGWAGALGAGTARLNSSLWLNPDESKLGTFLLGKRRISKS